MQKLKRYAVRFKGFTIGLDLHKKFIEYCVLDQNGDQVAGGRIGSTAEDLGKLIKHWQSRGAVQIAMEACGCFVWVFDQLAAEVGREFVHVGQPSRIQVIANSMEKNDANDAWWLAYLLYEGRLPEAFVAEGALRELRIATRELRVCTDQRSDALRRLRSHLAQAGVSLRKNWHTSNVGREAAREVVKKVGGERGVALQALLRQIKHFSRDRAFWRERVEELSRDLPQVQTLIAELPGMGSVTASAVYAELGDPGRFRNQKAYAKATGLTPGYRESGGRSIGQPITRCGSRHARWALTRAILSCLRCKKGVGAQIKEWVLWRSRHKSKKSMMVAAARKLAEGIWRLFALGEVFDLARAFPVRS